MPSREDIEQQILRLRLHRRTLAHYLEQQAILSPAFMPPGVAHGIEESRREIKLIKTTLRHWHVPVEDLPDDELQETANSTSTEQEIHEVRNFSRDVKAQNDISFDDVVKEVVNRFLEIVTFQEREQVFSRNTNPLESEEEKKQEYVPMDGETVVSPQSVPFQVARRSLNFVGREHELAQIASHLHPGRVITLCGLGGIGKTSLAIEVVFRLVQNGELKARFPDGVIFVNFHQQYQADIALEHIARSYGEEPRPTPISAAQRALSNRVALVILDGAEQVDNLSPILEVLGNCGVLVTSRIREDAIERRFDVPPLPISEAMTLLRAWGGEYASNTQSSREVCDLVGGMPLALCLVGRYLSQREEYIEVYLKWLRQSPLDALSYEVSSHNNISILLKRSIEQLSDTAIKILGVVGLLAKAPFDWSTISIALVLPSIITRKALGELMNYGLIVKSEGWYECSHSLVHEYSRRNIKTEDSILKNLIFHYQSFISFIIMKKVIKKWRLDLAEEAMEHFICLRDSVNNTETSQAILKYLEHSYRELGHKFNQIAEAERAITNFERSLRLAREINEVHGQINSLGSLGASYKLLLDIPKSIAYTKLALNLSIACNDFLGQTIALNSIASSFMIVNDITSGVDFSKQALDISREHKYYDQEAVALRNLSMAKHMQGDKISARKYLNQAMALKGLTPETLVALKEFEKIIQGSL